MIKIKECVLQVRSVDMRAVSLVSISADKGDKCRLHVHSPYPQKSWTEGPGWLRGDRTHQMPVQAPLPVGYQFLGLPLN